MRDDARGNQYFKIATDPRLSDTARRIHLQELEDNDRFAAFAINLVSYGLCGMMIAMCLAVAEPLTQRKTKSRDPQAAGAGAAAGLLGGVAAALLIERISTFAASSTADQPGWVRVLASQAIIWGILGLFLGIGPGLVLRNLRKLTVGALGGLLGGLIGGALLDPIAKISHSVPIGNLFAFIAIGVVAGLATGWLENVVKGGWLKVTSGIIAGKQFILYRNPTYIGASPDCQIYLFKDNQVGKRHAALHLLATGIEIEDLPLGSATLVNGKPIKRAKLKNGDTIQIGSHVVPIPPEEADGGKLNNQRAITRVAPTDVIPEVLRRIYLRHRDGKILRVLLRMTHGAWPRTFISESIAAIFQILDAYSYPWHCSSSNKTASARPARSWAGCSSDAGRIIRS